MPTRSARKTNNSGESEELAAVIKELDERIKELERMIHFIQIELLRPQRIQNPYMPLPLGKPWPRRKNIYGCNACSASGICNCVNPPGVFIYS